MGLNDYFQQLGSQILAIDPLPLKETHPPLGRNPENGPTYFSTRGISITHSVDDISKKPILSPLRLVGRDIALWRMRQAGSLPCEMLRDTWLPGVVAIQEQAHHTRVFVGTWGFTDSAPSFNSCAWFFIQRGQFFGITSEWLLHRAIYQIDGIIKTRGSLFYRCKSLIPISFYTLDCW